jgi:rubrerythrin
MPSLSDQIREAIRKEKRVYDLYRLVTAMTADAERRAVTQRLADDAVRLLGIIERACRQHSPSLSTFFQHYVPDVKFAPTGEDQITSALQAAFDNKRELLDLYASLTATADETGWNEVFRELVEASEAHLEFVRTHLPAMA